MPTVSIIMNIRNGAATLGAALESAFAQTYSDWELIVWDDCSSDDSARIVSEFTDPRLQYHLAPQLTSLGQAREQAIRQARGEWLAFLDQDDIWLPRKLELQLSLADATKVAMVYGRAVSFYPNGKESDFDQFHEFCPLPEGDIFAELLGRGCFIAMSSALVRRSVVEEIGGIPAHIRLIPDYFLYLAMSRQHSVRAVQEAVCRYRVHPGNMTSVYRRESLKETLALVEAWGKQLPPEAIAQRHAGISTALALEELRCRKSMAQGVKRFAGKGPLLWLVRAPFLRLRRWLDRRLRQPYWKKP